MTAANYHRAVADGATPTTEPPRLGALISEAEPVRWITAAEYVARLRAREESA